MTKTVKIDNLRLVFNHTIEIEDGSTIKGHIGDTFITIDKKVPEEMREGIKKVIQWAFDFGFNPEQIKFEFEEEDTPPEPEHNFDHLNDLDLVEMQSQLRATGDPSDKEMATAILVELGNRQKPKEDNQP